MTGTLKGIGQYVVSYFGGQERPADESLDEWINTSLAEERQKIRPSREDIDVFGWVTGDNNPVHRIKARAKLLGFDDIPLMGAHVAAYGEQFIEGVVQKMRDHWDAKIKIVGQDNKFKAAVHPGERILWQVTGYKKSDEGLNLAVSGSVKDRHVVDISAKLAPTYGQMPQIAGPIFSQRFLLHEDHLEAFYNCVGGKPNGSIPNMLPASYVPATLLELLKVKTQTMEGANLSMKFDFLDTAKPGRIQVDVFPDRKPKETKIKNEETGEERPNFIYTFKTVVSQDTKPITYGVIRSSTPYKIDMAA